MRLGGSEVYVSPLGTGVWAWGDRLLWGYGRSYGEAECREAFRASLAGGVTLFDTAEVYGGGTSERLLGQFLREGAAGTAGAAGAAGTGEAVVATKFAPFPWRLRPDAPLRALRASLARLGRTQVDLYQIHFPMPLRSLERRMEGLAETVRAGLTRAVGVSNYGADDLRRAHDVLARMGVPLASNQVRYSLLHRSPERNGVLAACRERGITLIAYSPLAQGLLTGKFGPGRPPPWGRRLGSRPLAELEGLLGALRDVGEAHGGKTAGQVALNWLIGKGTVPIPGAKNARQGAENAGALGWRLAPAEAETLERLSP